MWRKRAGKRKRWAGLGMWRACSVGAVEDKVVQGLLLCLTGYSRLVFPIYTFVL